MVMSRRMRDQSEREQAARDAKKRAERDAATARAEQHERKFLREIEEEDARAKVDPPPELSPSERHEREMVERIERLEGNQAPVAPVRFNQLAGERQNRRREQLRLLRNRTDIEKQEKYERELGIASAQKHAEDEQGRIGEARDAAVAAIDARARQEQQAAREQADAEVAATWESFEQTARAKLEKAPPEVRELLERLNHRLSGLLEAVEV
jgi:translation initiation factor IF-2